MAGYTDKVYRSIGLKKGAALAYTEMVSGEGVARDNDKTVILMMASDNRSDIERQIDNLCKEIGYQNP